MTSLQRKMRRAKGMQLPERNQPYRDLPCGGHEVLHATRGWQRFSLTRLIATAKHVNLLEQFNRKFLSK